MKETRVKNVVIGPTGIEASVNERQNLFSILVEGTDAMIGEIRLWSGPDKLLADMTDEELFKFAKTEIKNMFEARDVKELMSDD